MAKYFIQDTTLTNIADAIREKAGITSALFPENMPSYIRSIQTTESDTTGIPDDIVAEAERVASGMISKRGGNSITAIIMSDMHEFGDNDHSDATIMERYRRANMNAGQGAKVVADNIDVDFFANLGDWAWGAKTSTVTDFVQSIVNARNYCYDVIKNHESFLTVGNHDTATYGFAQNNEHLSQSVLDGLIGTYRYADFNAKKIRVICLNTAEIDGLTVSGESGTERMTGTQLQWFAEALDLSNKSDASDWGIIILSHHPLDWGNIKVAANCLAAYLDGASYSVTHNGVAVSYDFSGKNAAKVICQFHGHVHGFRVDYINDLRTGSPVPTTVQRVAIPNACYGRNNEYGENSGADSNGIEFGEETSYKKTDDSTGKNTAFCLISIDLDNEIIYADCFGAGYDRVINYGEAEVVTFSVSNNLTNATISNGTTTITEGASYAAGIIANDGYELEAITVTMGGTDVTDTAVSGNIISIANVTGDIVVTASAVYVGDGTYTNLVPTSIDPTDGATIFNSPYGYKNGTYVSGTNSNTDATDGTYVSTGAILLANDVDSIYIKGATWDETSSYVRFYAGSLGAMNSYAVKADGSGTDTLSEFFTVETLSENYYKWTLNDNGKSVLCGKYYRISLVGTGENLIITHNQPIPDDAGGSTVVNYNVTNTLTNVINSNAQILVAEGTSYTATLTAADGYEISTVTVTMGGTDVTASAYGDGEVNIANVSGDIVITATATEKETESSNYTNLVTTAQAIDSTEAYNGTGYKNGYYLSSSSPFEGTDSTTVLTGYIPYPVAAGVNPGTIYIKGADWKAISHCRLMFFTEAKTSTAGAGINGATTSGNGAIATHFTVETGDKYVKLTPIMDADGDWVMVNLVANSTNIKFFRMSLYGTGENLIITVNEPIE